MGFFAFRAEAREKVIRKIANLATFEHRGISGRQGPCNKLGLLPRQYGVGLSSAVYVVYCYNTPIAWVWMNESGPEDVRVNFMPDWQYSATTTYYQNLVRAAWGDDIQDSNTAYSRAENRGTDRGRLAEARYGRGVRISPADRMDFRAQDDLMDEVNGYRHPAHP